MNKVSSEDIELAGRVFDRYDMNATGDLSVELVEEILEIARENDARRGAKPRANPR